MTERRAIQFEVNGQSVEAVVEPRWLLSDVLRHQLGLTGTHVGCEQGVCGACTILLDGDPARSCLMFAVQAPGHRITTVEGISPQDGGLSLLQQAFQRHHALQCGYCTAGMLLTAHALLSRNPHPDEKTIRQTLSGNLCRCTGYQNIVEAILDVREMEEKTDE